MSLLRRSLKKLLPAPAPCKVEPHTGRSPKDAQSRLYARTDAARLSGLLAISTRRPLSATPQAAVDFSQLRPLLDDCDSAEMGRGALDPVCLLKLLLLQFHYGWSDESVMQQAQVNVAMRFFLDWPLATPLPDPSLLTHFRKRVGAERLRRVFDEILKQARAAGLVKDRLRLKDATHVIANIAVPATIQLVAQVREKLLAA